jgi:hypothetical protein
MPNALPSELCQYESEPGDSRDEQKRRDDQTRPPRIALFPGVKVCSCYVNYHERLPASPALLCSIRII